MELKVPTQNHRIVIFIEEALFKVSPLVSSGDFITIVSRQRNPSLAENLLLRMYEDLGIAGVDAKLGAEDRVS